MKHACHSFPRRLVRTYYVPETTPGTGNFKRNKIDTVPALVELLMGAGRGEGGLRVVDKQTNAEINELLETSTAPSMTVDALRSWEAVSDPDRLKVGTLFYLYD